MSREDYQECLELLVYMLTSAAGLGGEPKIYGPLRMAEAAQRLGQIMLKSDPGNQNLAELIALIEDGKRKTMSDENGFYQMLQDTVAKLVDLM